jgi:hypothetical protein
MKIFIYNLNQKIGYFINNFKQCEQRRMVSSGMLRRMALVRSDISEELSASFITVARICELGKMLAVTSNRRTELGISSRRALVASYS